METPGPASASLIAASLRADRFANVEASSLPRRRGAPRAHRAVLLQGAAIERRDGGESADTVDERRRDRGAIGAAEPHADVVEAEMLAARVEGRSIGGDGIGGRSARARKRGLIAGSKKALAYEPANRKRDAASADRGSRAVFGEAALDGEGSVGDAGEGGVGAGSELAAVERLTIAGFLARSSSPTHRASHSSATQPAGKNGPIEAPA